MPSTSGPRAPRPAQVLPRSLGEIADRLGTPVRSANITDNTDNTDNADNAVVSGVALDARAVAPGDIFAAVPGARSHGADHAASAASKGALACLTDEAGSDRALRAGLPAYVVKSPRSTLGPLAAWLYGDPSRDLTMLGVTGTNGKTTTCYLLEAGLRAAGMATGLIGTIETRIGAEVLPSARTTPEAPDLQALLAVMRERDVRAVAMEVSSHALAMGRVDGTTYDVAVFTNLSEDHLDFHADLEEYFEVKASLFTPDRAALGVIDIDDPAGRRLCDRATIPMVTVSAAGADADWRVLAAQVAARGSRFTLLGPAGQRVEGSTALPGDFNVSNAALALVALAQTGLDLDVVAAGIAGCPGVPGRMEQVSGAANGPLALVDYAHTPDALARLLATARDLVAPGGRLVLVVGAGGDRDPHKRPAMGAIAARGADLTVLTSDNPRTEDPQAILDALLAGAQAACADGAAGRVEVELDRRAAITRAVASLQEGDVVVVAGKGHEQGQELGDQVHPFDDRVVLAEALLSTRSP